ncbi:MAG TPA: hypothetical protein VMH37_03115 [Candidatus Binataceae bacterium]|nr:hypothetical protein [Candidatus Binataceae bacterium]
MSRDFEVRQLLRAYRSGLLTESAFEEEMNRLEHDATGAEGGEAPRFEALGQVFRSERDAVLTFFDRLHATQIDAALAFAKWAAVCRTAGLRSGLILIAERAACHARLLERRAREIGGQLHSLSSEHGSKLVEVLANPEISDLDKLMGVVNFIPEPREAAAPIANFATLLKSDLESRQALRLIAEDELSTAGWLHDVCSALTGAPEVAARAAEKPPA